VDNNYLDLGMNKSGFIHTLPIGRLSQGAGPSAPPFGSAPENTVMIKLEHT
jgi:hypothetical protein